MGHPRSADSREFGSRESDFHEDSGERARRRRRNPSMAWRKCSTPPRAWIVVPGFVVKLGERYRGNAHLAGRQEISSTHG